ncbi:MAG TPA: XTP/dITP diphosphatase [Dehalococcoidia bacterium]
MDRPVLLLATGNAGKVRELRQLLAGVPFELATPADLGLRLEVEEDGQTYHENALKKATAYAAAAGLPALADDSGLEVDVLDGRPGVHSARYVGQAASDGDRIGALLAELRGVPPERRTARFRAVIAVAAPDGRRWTAEGTVEGVIAQEPRGRSGFGYDPIFLLPELGRTMAELPAEEKNRVSHRARAAAGARRILEELAREGGGR